MAYWITFKLVLSAYYVGYFVANSIAKKMRLGLSERKAFPILALLGRASCVPEGARGIPLHRSRNQVDLPWNVTC